MSKLLSLILMLGCLLFRAEDAFAVSAVLYNNTNLCVCIRAESAGGLRNGHKDCSDKYHKIASSAPGRADFIRSVRFTFYDVEKCEDRRKSNELKDAGFKRTFDDPMGRRTRVHFSVDANGTTSNNNPAVQFNVYKISWLSYCKLWKSDRMCDNAHQRKLDKVQEAEDAGLIIGASVAVIAIVGTAAAIGPAALIAVGVGSAIATPVLLSQ